MGFSILSSFLEILNQTLKIFFRNGKLMPSITLLSFFVNSILLFSYLFANKLLATGFSNKLNALLLDQAIHPTYNPESPPSTNSYYLHLITLTKNEIRLFVLASLIFTLAIFFTSLFLTIATILVSAENFVGKQLYVKEIAVRVRKSWQRALVTLCYTTLLGLGYVLFVLALILVPLELFFLNPLRGYKISTISIIALVLAMILYCYFAVVWILALVVSVLEDKCGYEALGRASELVKGLKLQGFFLIVLYNGLSYATFRVLTMSFSNKKVPLAAAMMKMNMTPLVLMIAVGSLIKAFSLISYTVLYFEGKKIRGEEVIELQGYSVEYTKVPGSASLVTSDLP